MDDTLRIMDDWQQFMVDHKIEVKPVLTPRGDIDGWIANARSVLPDGRNYTRVGDRARGASPAEALEKLKEKIGDA